jgi:hypothetical protein
MLSAEPPVATLYTYIVSPTPEHVAVTLNVPKFEGHGALLLLNDRPKGSIGVGLTVTVVPAAPELLLQLVTTVFLQKEK